MALALEALVRPLKVVDWINNMDALKDMEDAIDDFLYDARKTYGVTWSTEDINKALHHVFAIIKKQAGG